MSSERWAAWEEGDCSVRGTGSTAYDAIWVWADDKKPGDYEVTVAKSEPLKPWEYAPSLASLLEQIDDAVADEYVRDESLFGSYDPKIEEEWQATLQSFLEQHCKWEHVNTYTKFLSTYSVKVTEEGIEVEGLKPEML